MNLSKPSSENIKFQEVENYQIPKENDKNKSTISNSNLNLKYFNENKKMNQRNQMKNKKPIETKGDYIHNESIENEKEENEKNEDNKEKSRIKKQKFNWFKFIWYSIICCNKNNFIEHYKKIRKNLISEENIIQNYFDIYNLLHINGLPKKGY